MFGLAEHKDGEVCASGCFGWGCQEQRSGCNRNHCGFFPQKWHEAQAAQVLPLAFLQV